MFAEQFGQRFVGGVEAQGFAGRFVEFRRDVFEFVSAQFR
jgi:hypothetical protein